MNVQVCPIFSDSNTLSALDVLSGVKTIWQQSPEPMAEASTQIRYLNPTFSILPKIGGLLGYRNFEYSSRRVVPNEIEDAAKACSIRMGEANEKLVELPLILRLQYVDMQKQNARSRTNLAGHLASF